MGRLPNFFRTRSFAILLFHVGVLLFSWPILTIPTGGDATALFSYLFLAWSALVVILIFVGVSIRTAESARKDGDDV